MSFCTQKLAEELKKGEYEAQLFQTSALSLAYSLKELIRAHVEKCLDKLNQTIRDKAGNPKELIQVKETMGILRERYQLAIEKQCKEMESKIYEVFNIPSHVLLPEDVVQLNQYEDEEVMRVDEEIRLLELRYKRAVCMEALLKKQRKLNKCVDLSEKAAFEIDNNVDTLKKIFEDRETNVNKIVDELMVYKYLEQLLPSFKNC